MGDMELNSLTVETLEDFRLQLVEERKLTLKTARNVIDGCLRAMFRDAGRRVDRNPFNDLPPNWWPRLPKKEPDPYTEDERDRISISIAIGDLTTNTLSSTSGSIQARGQARQWR